jgi:hypothetical protein
MDIKALIGKADDSILDEIVKRCEGHMVSPFKKEVTVEAVEPEESHEDSELSEEDLEKLLELYNKGE